LTRKFERLIDDEDENHVANEFPVCAANCGRHIRGGLGRDMRLATHCCDICMDSKGIRHGISCMAAKSSPNVPQHQIVACTTNMVLSAAELSRRASSLLSSIPSIDTDVDMRNLKAILDGICAANDLPTIDEKRFLLICSRFCAGQMIPKSRTREILYRLLKKVFKCVNPVNANPLLERHFFVTKESKVTKFYRFKSVLGQGSFGIVHRVVRIDSGIERVCKSISKSNTSVPHSQIESEIRIIATLDHPNIVKIIEYFEDDSHVHLIMEYCPDGDLLSRIKQSIKSGKPISFIFAQSVVRQLLCAVAFMQTHRVIHKDLKPENIMLVMDPRQPERPLVKIIDFGLSELFSTNQSTSSTVAGTAFYMSPQIFKPPFSFKADIWSIGVIAYFMLTGILPFFGSTVAEVKSNVLYRKIQWPSTFAGTPKPLQIGRESRDLIEKLLEKDEAPRLDAMEALKHTWLSGQTLTRSSVFSLSVALNINSFSRLSWWKRCMLNLVAHIWDFRDISSNLTHLFIELDNQGIGSISIHQMATLLHSVGIPIQEGWDGAKALDLTHTGRITFTALVAGCIYPLIASDPKIVRALFNRFSPDKRDRISCTNIIELLSGNHSYCQVVEKDEMLSSLLQELSIHESECSTSSSQSRTPELDINTFRKWILTLN